MGAILSAASFSGITVNECAFPTVLNAERALGDSAIDKWYLYCAPHDTPGGIYLATAAALSGPWTAYQQSAILPTPSPYRHVSSPFVTINPRNGKLHLYGHMLNQTGDDTQDTYLWTSMDGLSWSIANGGDPVIAHSADAGDNDTINAAYHHVTWTGSGWLGFYQGAGTGAAHVAEASSNDGIAWVKNAGVGGNKAWTDESGVASQAPTPVVVNGRTLVIYNRSYLNGAGARRFPPTTRWKRADGVFTRAAHFPLQVGQPSTFDAGMVTIQDVAWEDGKLYVFYGANSSDADSNDGDVVGSAYATCATNPLTYGNDMGKS